MAQEADILLLLIGEKWSHDPHEKQGVLGNEITDIAVMSQ